MNSSCWTKGLFHVNVPCLHNKLQQKTVDFICCKSIVEICSGWISKHFLRNPFHAISEEQQFQNFGRKTAKIRTKNETKVFCHGNIKNF